MDLVFYRLIQEITNRHHLKTLQKKNSCRWKKPDCQWSIGVYEPDDETDHKAEAACAGGHALLFKFFAHDFGP